MLLLIKRVIVACTMEAMMASLLLFMMVIMSFMLRLFISMLILHCFEVCFLVAVVHIVDELSSYSAVGLGRDCDCDCVEAALRSVMREILVWCMFNFMELNLCCNRFCLTLIGCILFPALMFALARSHQCFLKVMVVTAVIVMMKE